MRYPTRTRNLVIGAGFVALLATLAVGQAMLERTADAQTNGAVRAPRFEVDPLWPKPLPNHWVLGSAIGVWVDVNDHVWIIHRSSATLAVNERPLEMKTGDCCAGAPPVLEFDQAGNLLRHWGGPGQGYEWPDSNHGIFIDYKGNVWIGGSQTRVGRNGEPQDGMVLKFTHDGKFLMQIGGRGPSKGNLDPSQLQGAANFVVDEQANEVYIADGYGHHRVIVFDADTGKFKRLWGAYGKPPTDDPRPAYDPKAPPSTQFALVHGIRIARDGLVYVSDRLNDRVQVFKKDGTYVTEFIYDKETLGSGSVGNVALWPDRTQSIMAINDPGNFQIRFARRSDGVVLGTMGHFGTYAGQLHLNHQVEFDSEGNLYTSEDSRVQKFVPTSRPGK